MNIKLQQMLVDACEAALKYDSLIEQCSNDPNKMSSACTAEGDDLDTLYEDWLNKSNLALATYKMEKI